MATKTVEIYQIKVTLRNTKPPIWRRLLVPAGMTLDRLHRVLQTVMGWEDCHLHEFRIGEELFGPPAPDLWGMGGPPVGSERTAKLSQVMGWEGAKARYTYDFGDNWEHEIGVEKVLPVEPGLKYPVCVAGELHGPPEDSGGVYGYYNLLLAFADPAHEDHADLCEWLGEGFDPEEFSVEEVNQKLRGRTLAGG
jgi:hypothetical protein